MNRLQALVGAGVMAMGGLMALGAMAIPSTAGYAGVGPNFLPWLVSLVLLGCGVGLVWQACRGGFRQMPEPSGSADGDWRAMAWVGAGVLLNAATITRIGFILSCALCYVLAVRGLRLSEGKPAGSLPTTLVDVGIGLAIAAPVFWLFTQLLAINLPGLTGTGWL